MKKYTYKIALSDYKNTNNKLKNNFFYINFLINQDIKDIGKYSDMEFNPLITNTILSYQPLINKLNYKGLSFNFMNGSNFNSAGKNYKIKHPNKELETYFSNNIIISGTTEDNLSDFESYGFDDEENGIFNQNINLNEYTYINYKGNVINGVDKIVEVNNNFILYTDSANINDNNLGTFLQKDGILYKTYLNENIIITIDDVEYEIPLTEIFYKTQGFNQTNIDLKSLYMIDYLLGITEKPKVINDIFIDRGNSKVIQNHMQMGHIKSIFELEKYGNNYYNITKQ